MPCALALPEAAICHADGPSHARDRPLERAGRQSLSTRTLKDRQLNLKVTHIFHERVTALARNGRMSMVELVERAVEAYAQKLEQEDA